MTEIWKDVLGFEGLYRVSNFGRVFSVRKNKILCPRFHTHGYLKVSLGRRVERYVHRLVLSAFLGIDTKRTITNHKNGIKSDNRLDNIEWCTHSENMKHAHNNGLATSKNAVASRHRKDNIILDTISGVYYENITELANCLNIKRQWVSRMLIKENQFSKRFTLSRTPQHT